MTTEELLAVLNSNIARLLTIHQLQYNLDQRNYLAQKVSAGEAEIQKGAYYILIAPGGTSTLILPNIQGHVAFVHEQWLRVSQEGVISLTIFHDDAITPWLILPALAEFDIVWATVLPYGNITEKFATFIHVNNDVNPQWVIGGWIGTYVRKDVWERDSAIMRKMAEVFAIAAMPQWPLPPLPPPTGE